MKLSRMFTGFAPRFYYNLTGNRDNQAHYAQAIVQLKSDEGVSELAQDLQNELDVQAFITTGVLPNTVLTALKERLAAENFELPLGYRYEFGGEYAERNTAIGNLLLYVPLLVLVMITALVLSPGLLPAAEHYRGSRCWLHWHGPLFPESVWVAAGLYGDRRHDGAGGHCHQRRHYRALCL